MRDGSDTLTAETTLISKTKYSHTCRLTVLAVNDFLGCTTPLYDCTAAFKDKKLTGVTCQCDLPHKSFYLLSQPQFINTKVTAVTMTTRPTVAVNDDMK